jgi:CRISPR-associated protein Csx10
MAKIKIITKSYTAIASGEGAGIIDSDIIYDSLGLPFIPAKRLKGLFKDSAQEILNFVSIGNGNALIEELFGTELKQGKAVFENAYIENYENLKNEIEELINKNEYKNFLSKSNILSFFTTIRQQTAIDNDGIAKEHSLRTIRVLNPNINFETTIDVVQLSEQAKALLYLAIKNLRRLGLNRNMGFGLVECNALIDNINDSNVLNLLQNSSPSPISSENTTVALSSTQDYTSNNIVTKYLKITTLSPVLLSERAGDLNTTDTRLYIPGTTIRGLLANRLIKKLALSESNAHLNPLFKTCFIDDKLSISFAYPFKKDKIFTPFPQNLQSEKGKKYEAHDIFVQNQENTKANSGFVSIIDDEAQIKILRTKISTRAYFHGTRDDRKGKNTDGAIFYYDSIEPNEQFLATITAPEEILNDLQKITESAFDGRIGRSKTSQYGKVKIDWIDNLAQKPNDLTGEDEITLVVISPLILLNQYGTSESSTEILKEYLKNTINADFEIHNQVCRITKVDYFNRQWGCKSQTYRALNEGSTFHLKFSNPIDENLQQVLIDLEKNGIGELTPMGYGRVKFIKIFYEKLNIEDLRNINIEDLRNNRLDNLIPLQYTKNILEKVLDERYKVITEHLGRQNAKKYKNITASLCGRMIVALQKFETKDDFVTEFLNKIKNKKAEKQLKDSYILDELKQEFNKLKNEKYSNCNKIKGQIGYIPDKEKLYKYYWIAFFKQMRLNAKKKNKINNL